MVERPDAVTINTPMAMDAMEEGRVGGETKAGESTASQSFRVRGRSLSGLASSFSPMR